MPMHTVAARRKVEIIKALKEGEADVSPLNEDRFGNKSQIGNPSQGVLDARWD